MRKNWEFHYIFPQSFGHDLEKRCPREVEHLSCREVALPGTPWLGSAPTQKHYVPVLDYATLPLHNKPENFPLCPMCAAVLVGSIVMVTIVLEFTESFRSSGYLDLCPEEHFHLYCFFLVVQWFCCILFQFRSLFPWEVSCNYSLLPPKSPYVSF